MTPRVYLSRCPWGIPVSAGLLFALGLCGLSRGDELYSGTYHARQLVWAALALPVMLAAGWIPYRFWRPWSVGIFAVSLVLLGVVYLLPPKFGAHRWIPFGAFHLQPSELAKLAFILMLAQQLMSDRSHRRLAGLARPVALAVLPVVLILKEPDLGTALLFIPVLLAMLAAAGARGRHLLLVTAAGIALAPALWGLMSSEQRSRITAVFRQQDGGEVPRGDEFHLHQSKQMIAFGGLFGSALAGMPVSDPLAYHLPASRTELILLLIG
jgi:cell division protein FtsW (lipid II flippase)